MLIVLFLHIINSSFDNDIAERRIDDMQKQHYEHNQCQNIRQEKNDLSNTSPTLPPFQILLELFV
jgi:hypothetical protein